MPKIKGSHLYLLVVFILIYSPIIYLMVYSFNEGDGMTHFTGFTLDHFRALMDDRHLFTMVLNTLILGLLSALISTCVGTAGAIYIYGARSDHYRQSLLSFNNILLVMPDVMIGASFLILFTLLLPISLGFWTVLLSHIAFNVPIVVLMVLPKLYQLNPTIFLAAEDLGASDFQILNRVILPNIWSGILSGFFMALTYSLDDFAVTFFLTGGGYSTLAVEIYSRARQGISLEINALSTIIFFFSLLVIMVYYLIEMRGIQSTKGANHHE